MLSVRNLRKTFASTIALDGVSFDVRRGEILGLLGPNGAGKTTSIRIILDILRADGGEVRYDGQPFSPAIRNIVGYLPEERGLYRKSSVLEILTYFGELRGMSRSAARREAGRWLERVGLMDRKGSRVEELSKGNQQKLQFIGALLHDPALVILDEPFSGLDPVNQLLFKDVMQELKRRDKAVIFSTHQMDHAERLSDSLCLINRGMVVLGGLVRDVKQRYGRNALHIEFDGDGSFMSGLPGIQHALLYERTAELELGPLARTRDLIDRINGSVEVRKIEIVEPSLHSIFLQLVGEPARAGLSNEATA